MRQDWQILPHHRRGVRRWFGPLDFNPVNRKPDDDASRHSSPDQGCPVLHACFARDRPRHRALAQSGSAGGSIGNDEKSLSGSRAGAAVGRTSNGRHDAANRKPTSRAAPSANSGGGGGGNFDGAWIVNAVGVTCSGTSTTAVVVTSGKIIGEGLSGSISPSGASRSVGNYDGLTVISTGRASGRSGSGTFKRSDGCVGTWTVGRNSATLAPFDRPQRSLLRLIGANYEPQLSPYPLRKLRRIATQVFARDSQGCEVRVSHRRWPCQTVPRNSCQQSSPVF